MSYDEWYDGEREPDSSQQFDTPTPVIDSEEKFFQVEVDYQARLADSYPQDSKALKASFWLAENTINKTLWRKIDARTTNRNDSI